MLNERKKQIEQRLTASKWAIPYEFIYYGRYKQKENVWRHVCFYFVYNYKMVRLIILDAVVSLRLFYFMFSRARFNYFDNHKLPFFFDQDMFTSESMWVFWWRISSKPCVDYESENTFLLKFLFVCRCSLNWMMIFSQCKIFLSCWQHKKMFYKTTEKKVMMTLNTNFFL